MFKRIAFITIVTLAIVAGIFWYFYTGKVSASISSAINVVPEESSVIIESKKISELWKKISQTNIIWEELLGINSINEINSKLQQIDSLIKGSNGTEDLLNKGSTIIAFIKTEKSNFDFLISYSLPDLTYQNTCDEFFKYANGGKEILFEEYNSDRIGQFNSLHCYFTHINGTIVISPNRSLIKRAIDQYHSGKSIANNNNFKKILQSAGKTIDASIFINYSNCSSFATFLQEEKRSSIANATNFAGFSGWDITIKPNAVSLSGFTQTIDSTNNFLSLFKEQNPQKTEVYKILPAKTALFLSYGISNTQQAALNYKKYLPAEKQASNKLAIDTVNAKFGIDIEKEFLSCIGNELTLAMLEKENDTTDNAYCIFHTPDIDEAQRTLHSLKDILSENEQIKKDSGSYHGHPLSFIPAKGIIPAIWGENFSSIQNNYFTVIYNYVIFANSETELKLFIDEFESNKTLANDKNYKTFSENISSESNFYFYCSIPRSISLYKNWFSADLKRALDNYSSIFKKLEAFSIQFSNNENGLFYSNIYLKYNPEFKKETETLWELPMDTTISSKPYIVINHNTKAKEIFIQDDANKIYLISNTGKILWSKQLQERIMSEVIQIDAYKNDKLQMIFNTRSYIYMFDRNGNEVNGFPIKLRSPATNALSVVDYENNEDYRIFIATANKRIVCYKANGEQVTGFGFNKTDEQVFLSILFFNTASKDHICFVDTKGKIYIVNRQGETRIRIKEKLPSGIRNYFLDIGKDYSKSSIVAADTLGTIYKISLTGNKETTHLQDFETSPYFEFKDLNNDKIREYILLTRNELKVFSQDKSLLFKYDFEEKVSSVPMLFNFRDGSSKIGVVSEGNNQLFLFNENGSLYNQFPLTGNTRFSISDLNNQGVYNLVTGTSDKAIYVYQLQ